MSNEAGEFMYVMFPERFTGDEGATMCGFLGDPSDKNISQQEKRKRWVGKKWQHGQPCPYNRNCNVYVAISSFINGSRRKNDFIRNWALMLDDIGVGLGSKTTYKPPLPPGAIVETSPGNTQYLYWLEPSNNEHKIASIQNKLIQQKLLTEGDPGMKGVNRVCRLPGFINGKAKYGGNFRTRLLELNDRRYGVDEFIQAFGLKGVEAKPRARKRNPFNSTSAALRTKAEHAERIIKFLRDNKMIIHHRDNSDWLDVYCLNGHNHSDGDLTGAAVSVPTEHNGYTGAYYCHHGHCQDKYLWKEFTNDIADLMAEKMDQDNEQWDKDNFIWTMTDGN